MGPRVSYGDPQARVFVSDTVYNYSLQMDPMPAAVSAAVPVAVHAARLAPETLHPALWFGHQLGRPAEHALPSGFVALDSQLPGGGWPRRALTELLLPHPGVGEIRLLAGCLAAVQASGRLVMLFDPPAPLSAGALAQLGLDVEQLLVIDTQASANARMPDKAGAAARLPDKAGAAARLWALEQALASGHVGAVLAWLPPRLRADRLRRLQLAAQAHDGPAFVLRELDAARNPSAAPLRLTLHPGGADTLALHILKRRGPPLPAPLAIELPPVLSPLASQRARAALPAATFVNLA